MGLLREFSQLNKTISIVGMAKNSGKTTTLNYFIEEAMDENIALGVTSTGRDGESTDLVTGTDKPKVYLYEGTLVSVPTKLYELAEAGLEILRMTEYRTSIGPLLLCRVVESGYVQIAGPLTTKEHKLLCDEMLSLGAELILIDGAIDRKSIAAPSTSDGVILATGAVLSRNMKRVVEETAHVVGIYGLPVLENEKALSLIHEQGGNQILFLDQEEGGIRSRTYEGKTGLRASRFLDEELKDCTRFIYLPGALTSGVIEDIHPGKLKNLTFVLKDPTKIFIESHSWQQWCKKGLRVFVIENIHVLAVSVNPTAPTGYAFEHEELLASMRGALPNLPILDVKR